MTDTTARPAAGASAVATPLLSVRDGRFWRGGREHRILSGSMHYFRVHPDLWQDRLARLAALGVNTVDTYVAWNFHEEVEGDVRFDGWRDLEHFVRLAGGLGLDVILRPSPYICAEWSAGGIPAWLSAKTRSLRTTDDVFRDAVERWYDVLMPRVVPLQASFGGPVVAVQVENEYGSFGSDPAYVAWLRDALRSRGVVELLTTADGVEADMQRNGSVAGAVPTFTFGTGVARAEALRPAGMPLMSGELWGGWFDHWGENHHVRSTDSLMPTVEELLGTGGSVSLYMAHGGTNFGLWNGANHDGRLQPTVTSYDSDAPIGEDGTPNAKFEALRAAFAPFHDAELPELPPAPVFQPERSAGVRPVERLVDLVRGLADIGPARPQPASFEALGVADGAVAYLADVDLPEDAVLRIPQLHDRAVVFVDDEPVGVLERDGVLELQIDGPARRAEILIIVESLGRVNYGHLLGESKGILAGVLIGRRFAHGWRHRALPTSAPASPATGPASELTTDGVAVAEFSDVVPADAWLAFPGAGRAWVWLNGFLLGRIWDVGPQETLYAPAPLWAVGDNLVHVLAFDRLPSTVEVRNEPSLGPREEFIGS